MVGTSESFKLVMPERKVMVKFDKCDICNVNVDGVYMKYVGRVGELGWFVCINCITIVNLHRDAYIEKIIETDGKTGLDINIVDLKIVAEEINACLKENEVSKGTLMEGVFVVPGIEKPRICIKVLFDKYIKAIDLKDIIKLNPNIVLFEGDTEMEKNFIEYIMM